MNKVGLRQLNSVSADYRRMLLEDIENGRVLTEPVQQCACCESEKFEKVLDVDRFNLPFGTHICTDCGLVFTSPRIQNGSLPYYYDRYYHPLNYGKESLEKQNSLFSSEQGKKVFERINPFLKKGDLEVLEVGAGVGDVLRDFRAAAATLGITTKVTGTEYSSECLQKCVANNVDVIQGDAGTVLSLEKKFDIIILSHVFEHFVDLRVELETLKKLLVDGGLMYIEVPGIFKTHLKSYYDFSFLGYSVHAHMYNFTLATLEEVVSKSGFSLLHGSEEAYGVFQVQEGAIINNENQYLKISHYLEFLSDNQEYALSQRDLVSSQAKELLLIRKRESELKKTQSELMSSVKFLDTELKQSKACLSNIRESKRAVAAHKPIPDLLKKRKAYLDLLRLIDAS